MVLIEMEKVRSHEYIFFAFHSRCLYFSSVDIYLDFYL